MLVENSSVLKFLPQFSKYFRLSPTGVNKFFCSVVPEKLDKSNELSEKLEESNKLPEKQNENSNFSNFRFKFPEFLPNPNIKYRNSVREKLERREMLRRRNNILIPQFFVGSVLAVTASDKHAVSKMIRFVGICIMKSDAGLNSSFILRNVIENTGVEMKYSLYSPLIHKIEVLRLEKRLDDTLFYLRDAPNEYSTFPFDMLQEYHDTSKPVPINPIKVKINPRPWLERYERMDLKGVILPELSEKIMKQAEKAVKPWEKYDLMDEYRKITPEEEQKDIFEEVKDELKRLESKYKTERKKKEFIKPSKQKLF